MLDTRISALEEDLDEVESSDEEEEEEEKVMICILLFLVKSVFTVKLLPDMLFTSYVNKKPYKVGLWN